jgi:hypothetical protein
MIDDRDVWQAAVLLVKRYGDDAMLEAAERADQLLDGGRRSRRPRYPLVSRDRDNGAAMSGCRAGGSLC